MLTYPQIDPVAFHIGSLKVHWYGLMYVLGFAAAWILASYRAHQPNSGWTSEQVSDVLFYSALGVLIGGRVGYMLVYGWTQLLTAPWTLIEIWKGGMSFHGGLVGVCMAVWFYARKHKKDFFSVTDFLAPLVSIGLGAGRVGNFMNGELWGRPTDLPWGMVFPGAGILPRHPSQIYEFFLEGIILFLVVWWYSSTRKPEMAVSGFFLLGYGVFRFGVEFLREPDVHLGFVLSDWMTMGQLLSIPMIIGGAIIVIYAYQKDCLKRRAI
ncbi:MAG: prolipoprotein diacylglyceryl transferase [Proteobacteria bacterium]|nr:prolipoprotein diacylglyceryl transferase [Pseudomonadota bacterium]